MKKITRVLLAFVFIVFLASMVTLPTFAQTVSETEDNLVTLEGLSIIDHGSYQGNEGDSTVYNLNGEGLSTRDEGWQFQRNGNVGVDGTEYHNGFEVWIARWNGIREISWAYATFDIGGKYKTLTGKTNLISSYNTTNFDTTLYFYDGERMLASYNLTPTDYIKDININVEGVKELKLLVEDNIAVNGGTSFAVYDLFFDKDINNIGNSSSRLYEQTQTTGVTIFQNQNISTDKEEKYVLSESAIVTVNGLNSVTTSSEGIAVIQTPISETVTVSKENYVTRTFTAGQLNGNNEIYLQKKNSEAPVISGVWVGNVDILYYPYALSMIDTEKITLDVEIDWGLGVTEVLNLYRETKV